MAKGWHRESRRHALASKGIKTAVDNKPIDKIPILQGTYVYDGLDDWGRKTYITVDGKILKDVDGVLHTTTAQGEPDSPISKPVGSMKPSKQKSPQENIYSKDKWTEQELKLVLRRINAGKITPSEIFKQNKNLEDGEGIDLTPEQNAKGLAWLKSQHYTPSGKEKESSPYGYREVSIIDSTKVLIGVKDFYSPRGNYYYPLYEACGGGNCMEYYVEGGKINIVG